MDKHEQQQPTKDATLSSTTQQATGDVDSRALASLAYDDSWREGHRDLLRESQKGELAALAVLLVLGFVIALCVAILSGDINFAGWVFGFVLLGCAASAYVRTFLRIKNRRKKR